MNNFGSLFRIREVPDTTMLVATMKLKDSFGFRLVTINWGSFNESFTPVATFVMMNVFATLSRYMLEPTNFFDHESAFWIKSLLES